jgi:DNA integrity scanning protein DisA with diadenylate cyclase activity
MAYYQLSFPRSGANWVRYISRYFLNINKKYDHTDNQGSEYFKTHGYDVKDLRNSNRQLVFVLRNFRECVYRHHHEYSESGLLHYIMLLNVYNLWQSKKILIYYEDLITKPNIEIVTIGYFLNQTTMQIYEFLKQYDKHRAYSIEQYGNCESDSKSTIWYSNDIDCILYNKFITDNIPKHLLKYVERYL